MNKALNNHAFKALLYRIWVTILIVHRRLKERIIVSKLGVQVQGNKTIPIVFKLPGSFAQEKVINFSPWDIVRIPGEWIY